MGAKDGRRTKAERLNEKKARMAFRDERGTYYALDNAAVIMPSVTSPAATYLFRLAVTLDEAVNLRALQASLERTAARFPYFVVELRRGLFWHYLEPHEKPLAVVADAPSPCQDFDMHRRGTCLFRVRARERQIAVEFSHVLTDGTGGIRFLKNLLAEYFRQKGLDLPASSDPDLVDLDAPPELEETEDAYNRYFPESYPHPDPERPAWHLPGGHYPSGTYRIICGVLPLAPALAKARDFGVSLTELLTGAYLEALQEVWFSEHEGRGRGRRTRLAIEVPVNMRRFHATRTNRNFSLFVHVQQDLRLGRRSFEDLVAKVHHQLRHDIDAPSMARHISRNVSGGRMFFVRIMPLVLKGPFMRLLYSYYGENIISGVMSNLGAIDFPEALAPHIERVDFIPAPSRVLKTKASVGSWKGRLYVNFGSIGRSRELERHFFSRLRSLGLPVKIECNLGAED